MAVSDWHCELFGTVAVASFTDEQSVCAKGETSRAQFRSIETWRRTGTAWKMIGSETLALVVGPPAVTLSPATLEEYAGTYQTSTGTKMTFAVSDGALVASLNGGSATKQLAELKDVVFTPGRARFRKVFQRDASGRIVAIAFRRKGHDTLFRRIDASG